MCAYGGSILYMWLMARRLALQRHQPGIQGDTGGAQDTSTIADNHEEPENDCGRGGSGIVWVPTTARTRGPTLRIHVEEGFYLSWQEPYLVFKDIWVLFLVTFRDFTFPVFPKFHWAFIHRFACAQLQMRDGCAREKSYVQVSKTRTLAV